MATFKFTQNAENLIRSQLSYQQTSLKISDESLEWFDWNLADKPYKQRFFRKIPAILRVAAILKNFFFQNDVIKLV